jgi:hypothetical protein
MFTESAGHDKSGIEPESVDCTRWVCIPPLRRTDAALLVIHETGSYSDANV